MTNDESRKGGARRPRRLVAVHFHQVDLAFPHGPGFAVVLRLSVEGDFPDQQLRRRSGQQFGLLERPHTLVVLAVTTPLHDAV